MAQDTALISFLKFSLEKKEIPKDRYFIWNKGDERKTNDSLCLLKDGNKWIVAYSERGVTSEQSLHFSLRIAIKDFYVRLAVSETPWTFREEWESKTGQKL